MSSGFPSGRTARGFAIIRSAADAAALAARGSGGYGSILAGRHPFVQPDNASLTEAIEYARDSLPGFLALARRPTATMQGFSVKIDALAYDATEFLWIHPFAQVGEQFIGQIANTWRLKKGVKIGDTIAFTQDDIVDWMYVDEGIVKGNYSARALLRFASMRDRAAFNWWFGPGAGE